MPNNSAPFFAYGDGKIQTDFGSTGENARGVLLQPDGKLVVSGRNFLVRYNADGSVDTSFGADGKVTAPFSSSNGLGQVAALQADGKLLFAGTLYSAGTSSFAVARYLADGNLDAGFGADGIATVSFGSSGDDCAAVTVLDDGSILLAGTTMAGMNAVDGMVETLRLFDANGVQIAGDIDLTSAWAAAGTTAKALALAPGSSAYGTLVQA